MSRGLPKYRKHANGQAFVQHKSLGTPQNRMYLGKYGSDDSKRKYQQFIARLNASQSLGGADPDLTPSHDGVEIVILVAQYGRFANRHYFNKSSGKPSQEFSEMMRALRPLVNMFGDELANEFGPKKLKLIRQHWINEGKARTHINHQVNRVKRFWRWAVSEELVRADLSHGLDSVTGLRQGRSSAREQQPVKPVDLNDVKATLSFLSEQVSAMCRVQLLCGMRPQDVCNMRPVDIDRSGEIWVYTPHNHKNSWRNQQLNKAIPKSAQKVLEPFMDRDPESFLFSPRERYKVASSRVGLKYETVTYRRAIKYGIKKAAKNGVEIPHWSPNQLRHAIATIISEKLGQQKAQRWLGHKSLDTTAIYAEANVSEIIEIAHVLDESEIAQF